MSDEEKKQLAYIAGMLLKIATGQFCDQNEMNSLANIASELGFYDLDEKEFRW